MLLPVTSRHTLLPGGPVTVPLGADHVAAADEVWELLDAADPVPERDTRAMRRRMLRVV